jgi:hypothetical protein
MLPQSRPPLWKSPRFWLIVVVLVLAIAFAAFLVIGNFGNPYS